MSRWLAELWDSLLVKVVVTIVSPIVLGILYSFLVWLYRAVRALRLVRAARASVERREKDGIRHEGPGIWLRQPVARPPRYGDLAGNSIPILMIAATKGGVGKTSLSGSLAAHFAMHWRQTRQDRNLAKSLRVLVIDQDFQGSFSTMTVSVDSRYVLPSKSNRLVSGELGNGGVLHEAERVSQPGMASPLSIWTIPAYYDLAQAENRTMIEWLLPISDIGLVNRLLQLLGMMERKVRQTKDLRFSLAEALLDPLVQQSFDLVIVDSPPRLTTSHIQAMCASTHLLVPTILDGLSGDAVGRYLEQVATHVYGPPGDARLAVCPHLKAVGIVCTMVPNQPNRDLSGPVSELRDRIVTARLRSEIAPMDCFIRQRAPYRDHAGLRIAYAATSDDQQHRDLRGEVNRLALWLAPKLGSTGRNWTYHGS